MAECFICNRIEEIKAGRNNTYVAELSTGYVVMGDYQMFRGYTLFLYKEHVNELHQIAPDARKAYLWEMSEVAAAVYRAFSPTKMNYELLGNTDNHMHWHLFPRRGDDPAGKKPVWTIPKAQREAAKATEEETKKLIARLLPEIEKIPGAIARDLG